MPYSSPQEELRALGLIPVLGLEVEWYLRRGGAPLVETEAYRAALRAAAAETERLNLHSLDAERGPGQCEYALPHTADLEALVSAARRMNALVRRVAEQFECAADFSAKPYPDQYGSGVHLHLHLETPEGANVFCKRGEELSQELEAVLAGLLAGLPCQMPVFAPSPASWLRFVPGWHAPVKACWGTNNRTVALRLPDGSASGAGAETLARMTRTEARRIEHRVAGSDADIAAVCGAVLEGALLGLRTRPPLPPPVYGDAKDAQYAYPLLREWERIATP
jgi:gamma-glutamylputrescine synthase